MNKFELNEFGTLGLERRELEKLAESIGADVATSPIHNGEELRSVKFYSSDLDELTAALTGKTRTLLSVEMTPLVGFTVRGLFHGRED